LKNSIHLITAMSSLAKNSPAIAAIFFAAFLRAADALALANSAPANNSADAYSGISGPGEPAQGSGLGGWRSGREGVRYKGPHPKAGWQLDWDAKETSTDKVIELGLLPPIKPIWELHLRDTIITLGGDGIYYMTGSSGDNIWDRNDGIELWKSADLKKWDYAGLVWSLAKDATWQKGARYVWAPEIHYLKGKKIYVLTLCVGGGVNGTGFLVSSSGKPEGPYINPFKPDARITGGIDSTIFEDDDGKIYYTWGRGDTIYQLKDDLSGFADAPHHIELDSASQEKARVLGVRSGVGSEGPSLFKRNGKYLIGILAPAMKSLVKTSLIATASLLSVTFLHAADTPTNAPPASPTPPASAPVILTPKPAPTPRINGPKIFGVRPGSPFLYSIPATGDRPMTFAADGLPDGLKLDPATGRVTGSLMTPGEHKVMLRAKNALGAVEKPFRIVVGEEIALTPALGWNSYNCFGERVTQDLALRAARKMIALGLDRHGWTYVNMDDGWQGKRGGLNNALQADSERFTDIKAMVDEIHAMGLKAGLYSSPWVVTYGGKLGGSAENPEGTSQRWPGNAPKNKRVLPFAIGKYRFTYQNAKQFAEWGFDYLKLDWGPVEMPETKEMHQALRATGRDIVLSLSNNHIKNLFPIIGEVAPWAQSWRTTTDIRDVWGRVANDIGFAQDKWAPYCRPGHYNDADMLVVGHVGGWSSRTLHPSNLTPDEQYTHISLWCLLTSPLLIGTDLEKMDDFTLSLLTNDEVIDVNQDTLCMQAVRVGGAGDLKVYAKPLDDGSLAIGLFNAGTNTAPVTANWSDLKLTGQQRVRDLWRQKDVGVFADKFEAIVAPHGVALVKIEKTK
jgi:alpha-galactosidase